MKQLAISGTLVVSDAVFEMLQEQGMLAGEDLVGTTRSNNAIMFLLHDALEEWYRLKKTGVLDSTLELSKELSQLNTALRLLTRFGSGIQNGAESLAQVSEESSLEKNDSDQGSSKDSEPEVVEEPTPEPEPPKPPTLSRDQIRARLNGFMAKGGT